MLGWCPSVQVSNSIQVHLQMSIAVGVENVHQECPLSPSRVHRVSIECPPSPSRVLRRARRFLLLQVTCASSVGLPGLRGGVRACGSFLITLIATKTRLAHTDREKTVGHLIWERKPSDLTSFLSFFLGSCYTLPDT